MDVGTLLTRAQRLAGRVDFGFDSRTIQFLNEAVEHWARAIPWPSMKRTGNFVADGTRTLILPQHVFQILWMVDRTNKEILSARDHWDLGALPEYLSDATGPASWWREMGIVPVTQQPTTPAQIVVQTESSDSFGVHIAGFQLDTAASGTANHEFFAEELISVTGSGPHSSAGEYIRIMTIGKNDVTPADLKIFNGATLIGRVAANRYRSEYRNVEFLNIPSTGTQLLIGYLENPNPLTATHQHPHPSITPEYLVWYAAGLIHKASNEADLGELCMNRAEAILQERMSKERSHGERDNEAYPDPGYWNSEDSYSWPGTWWSGA